MHLLAALDQASGVVLGQAAVDGKSNEITVFAPLLDRLGPGRCSHNRRINYADTLGRNPGADLTGSCSDTQRGLCRLR